MYDRNKTKTHMNKFLLITVLPLLLNFTTMQHSGEDIFSISQSSIESKQKFIDQLDNLPNQEIFTLKKSVSLPSKNNAYNYTLDFLRHSGWDDEPGDYDLIEIKNNNNKICQVRNDGGWTKIEQSIRNYTTNDYFIPIYLSETTTAIIMTGFAYPTEPSLLTIIIIEKGTAKLVFNKEMYINNITKTDNSFSMLVQANIQQWDENNKPLDAPIINKIWSENGILKFQNL